MQKFFLYILPIFILAAGLMNFFRGEPELKTPQEAIQLYEKIEDHEALEKAYLHLIAEDSTNIEYHFNYLDNHYKRPSVKFDWQDGISHRSDSLLEYRYKKWAYSGDARMINIGFFGLSMHYFHHQSHQSSIQALKSMWPSTPYYNYLMARFYFYLDLNKSLFYLNNEIVLQPENQMILKKKGALLAYYQMPYELVAFLKDKNAKSAVAYTHQRYAYFESGMWLSYIEAVIKRFTSSFQWNGFIGAFGILVIWLIYLLLIRKVLLRSPFTLLLVFLLGMLFALGTSVLSDFNKYSLNFTINGSLLNDFLYCVVGIGMVEELVKFIPLLIVFPLIKKRLEPIDYLILASVSALGFAFLENLIYFESGGIKTMQGRALTANVTHMFNSSLIAYGWVVGRFSKKRNPYLLVLIYFLIASLAHGFYDFWLINSFASSFNFMTFLWLLMSMMIWASMLNNCINNSNLIEVKWRYHPQRLNNFLLFGLSAVFLLEYILVGAEYGASSANEELQKDIVSGSFLLIFLTFSLSRFDYIPNYWAPLRFWDWNIIFNMPRMTAKHFDWQSVLGQKIILNSFGHSGTLNNQLPITGTVVQRELISYDKNWYLIKLEEPVQWGFKKIDFVLIKPLKEQELLLDAPRQDVKLRIVSNLDNLAKKVKRKRDFLLIDYVQVNKM